MRRLRRLLFVIFLCLLSLSTATAFHVPPWDTGHNSFSGDPGDEDTDPGDDGPCKSGSPVELASGNFVYSARDLQIVGLGPAIDFTRTYNSRDLRKGPFGNGWVFAYDQRLVETTDGAQVFAICSKPNGKREVFTKQANGRYAAPPHVRATLVKNPDNTYTLRERSGVVRRFDAGGRLAALADRNGNVLTLAYDATGFPTSITDAAGRTVRLTKGADGKVESVTDPANRTFRYAYDSAGNLTRVTGPLGNSVTYQYDSKSNLTAIIDPRGNRQMGVTYDAAGRVATLLEGAETWTYSYLSNPKRTTRRDSSNRLWTFFYNDAGNLTRVTDPLGGSESYLYDANLNLKEITDKNGHKTTYTHDASGNPLTTKDALGNTKTFTYDPNFGQPLTARDRLGNVTRQEYDERGNLVKSIDAMGQTAQFRYDQKGQVTSVTDVAGHTTTFAYDAFGNLIKRTDPLGNSSTATFDVLGRTLSTTDAEGRVAQFTYDDDGHRLRTINPHGGSLVNEYDSSGNLIAVTLQNGARTTFEYDTLNRLTKTTNPLSQSTSFAYDRQGNLTSRTTPKGQQIQFTYDALNRLTRKSKPGDAVNYTYDAVGNLLTIADGDSTIVFVHDDLNRVIETRTGAGVQPATTIRYDYDANGNRRTMTNPAGGVTNFTYDALTRLTALTDPAGQTYGFTYDGGSRRSKVTRPGGQSTSYGYDAASRLTSLTHQSNAGDLSFGYTYDRVGNRLSMTDSAGSHTYLYDILYRVTAVTRPAGGGPSESYTYDPVGNRTASHLSAIYTHDTANRLSADAQFDYTYDANGNLTRRTERASGKATNFTYDPENQLTQIGFPDGTAAAYRYDGMGRRIEKNVNGQITRYVYDGQDILFEYSGATLQARYTHGPGTDEVLSVQRGADTSFIETDASGSVVRVTDGATAKATYVYDSYGRIVNQTGTRQTPHLFQGREFDQESGLYYFRARYYDPGPGRFISEDPLSFGGGANFYLFALNNPVNFFDPFGLRPCTDEWLDNLQTLLDLAGLIPGFGEFFDIANAGIYGLRGDYLNAGLSLGSAVPFLGWGGTAAKFANKAASSPGKIVIGEGMDRVRDAARRIGAETFEGKGMDANRAWIRDKVSQGYEVHDIGPHFERRLDRLQQGQRPNSPFYNMERQETKGYDNYFRQFERNGKYQGGVPGLDY